MDHALQLRKFADRCMASDVERAGLRAAASEIERLRERVKDLEEQVLRALGERVSQ